MSITNPEADHALSSTNARQLTDKIRAGLEGVYQLIIEAFQRRIWVALGYNSWDEYVRREFGNLALRPPLEARDEVIQSMRDAGMSLRSIGTATQMHYSTVSKQLDKAGVEESTPRENPSTNVIGQDGKVYRPKETEPSAEMVSGNDTKFDAVLDSSPEDVGVRPLDMDGMRSEREARTRKLIKDFNNRNTGSLPRTLQLAEQISGLVSPVNGETTVARYEYESLTRGISAAVRQFSYVVKTLSGAGNKFDSEQAHQVVVEDLQAALGFLRDSVRVMENK